MFQLMFVHMHEIQCEIFWQGGYSLVSFLRGLFQGKSDGCLGLRAAWKRWIWGLQYGLRLSSENMKSYVLVKLTCSLALRSHPSIFW